MNFVKIKIDEIINLSELSTKYEMTIDEIIQFHNTHCDLHEILPLRLEKYTSHLYLPKDKYDNWAAQQVSPKKIIPRSVYDKKTYGVVIKGTSKNESTKIHYLIDVQRNGNSLKIHQHQVFMNDQEVNSLTEKLLETAGKSLYPLELLLNENDEILEISNTKEIRDRWTNNYLPELQNYYKDQVAEELINKLQLFFNDSNAQLKDLYKNIFINLYLLPIYKNISNTEKVISRSIYSSILNQWVPFSILTKYQKTFTKNQKIEVVLDGISNSDSEKINSSNLHFTYHLDKLNNCITSIHGFIDYEFEDDEISTFVDIYLQK